ncbi:DUF3244 domain-containing protein [Massilibacteroides vaginae]|uniref:DUF3244 domain-containing protein n=1 Tax=Massilibacteroides vaginae TaxID=1673718 RepID=UPI000A1CAEE7|nr:DUF3244 domain-containing protein [Massilibacteroides vaginae]
MYKRNLLVILALILTSISIDAFATKRIIPIRGKWFDNILRSSTEPIVTIEDTTLEIYFPTELNDVLISIYDEQGNYVFEQYVSVGAMESCFVNLFNLGVYRVEIMHFAKGVLRGDFIIK